MASSSCLSTVDRGSSKRAPLISTKEKQTVVDGQPNPLTHNKRAVPLKRLASAEDDLVLGVEASLYDKNINRMTVQEYIRSLKPQSGNPSLSRWNSVTSSFSVSTGIKSVMDVLDRWQDDPEEVLLDLGFGVDEPDISIKIPSRFINCPSRAQGINIRVFLEAQKMRMDTENPDYCKDFVIRRANSCQSDSSGFLEEPSVPSLLQKATAMPLATKYTTNEIEIITKSLRTFRERLIDLEEELDDEQASVYSILSDLENSPAGLGKKPTVWVNWIITSKLSPIKPNSSKDHHNAETGASDDL
ncbi:Coiled-coil domain-containing protein 129 [Acipenser ruthenus]|uniref:Coiled-coil domain-containing protein 129 n=1 Tax=Acipenser ruthenus TaxID=7906 RepID=A0A662YM37_ACIRT|nr:Coiled-coil domain-containing protein 129 [Acipenser ruthenus]